MIYIEKSALGSQIAENVLNKFSTAQIVDDGFEPEDSKKNILISPGANGNIHTCPATREYRCCNYYVTDIAEGCPFDCTYCILQAYLSKSYIKVYSDTEHVFNGLRELNSKGKYRVGTGELADSLALDNILDLTPMIADVVNGLDNIQFEFKTKSANIDNLLNINPKNIVVSWSLNPQKIASGEEHGAASITERLRCAKTLQELGFKLAFHFDPMIYYDGWEEDYAELADELCSTIDPSAVEYISISSFRFMPELLNIVRGKFSDSLLLKNSYISSLDGKMRYFKPIRAKMLRKMVQSIRKHWSGVFIYFCMEHDTLWDKILGGDPGSREELEQKFPLYGSRD